MALEPVVVDKNKHLTSTKFTNPTNKDFVHSFDWNLYKIWAWKTVYMPTHIAELFAAHLAWKMSVEAWEVDKTGPLFNKNIAIILNKAVENTTFGKLKEEVKQIQEFTEEGWLEEKFINQKWEEVKSSEKPEEKAPEEFEDIETVDMTWEEEEESKPMVELPQADSTDPLEESNWVNLEDMSDLELFNLAKENEIDVSNLDPENLSKRNRNWLIKQINS